MHCPNPPAWRGRLATVVLCAVLSALAACSDPRDAASPEPEAEVAQAPALPPAPPGTEEVPEAEAEPTGPGEDTPIILRPRQSFARDAGLHRVADPLHLDASAALLFDIETGKVLYRKNEDAVLPIASLTKLMTGLVIAQAKLPLDEVLTITDDDIDMERHSRSRLRVGTQLTRGEALHLALMSSENRAAHALGRTYPGGLSAFVEAMNSRARLLGMEQTTYVDPTGLSNRNQSTASDLARIALEAARHPLLREYSTTPSRQVEFDGRKLLYRNSNRLVQSPGWDIALQKTGYIIEAGQCLAMATHLGPREVVLVLLDAASKGSRSADAERMRRWMVAQYGPGPAELALAAQAAEAKKQKKAARQLARANKGKGKGKEGRQLARETRASKKQVAQKKPAGKQVAQKKSGQRVKKTFAQKGSDPNS